MDSFSWGIPQITQAENLTSVGYGSGKACNGDDFIGIDQASVEGSGPGEDRLCGNKLLEYNQVICKYNTILRNIFYNFYLLFAQNIFKICFFLSARSKPFSLRVRSN